MSLKQVASLCGLSDSTVRRLVKAGKLSSQPRVKSSAPLLFSIADVTSAGLSPSTPSGSVASETDYLLQRISDLEQEVEGLRPLVVELAVAKAQAQERQSIIDQLVSQVTIQGGSHLAIQGGSQSAQIDAPAFRRPKRWLQWRKGS